MSKRAEESRARGASRVRRWAVLVGALGAVGLGGCAGTDPEPEPVNRYGAGGGRPPYPTGAQGTVDPLVPSAGGAGWEGRRSNYGGGAAPGYGGGYSGAPYGAGGYGQAGAGQYGAPMSDGQAGGAVGPGGGDEVDRLLNQAGVGEVSLPGGGTGGAGTATGGTGVTGATTGPGTGSVVGTGSGQPTTGRTGTTTGATGQGTADGIPYARPVPGEPGRVYSPYGDGVTQKVDVSGFERGRLVFDPHSGKKFRVP